MDGLPEYIYRHADPSSDKNDMWYGWDENDERVYPENINIKNVRFMSEQEIQVWVEENLEEEELEDLEENFKALGTLYLEMTEEQKSQILNITEAGSVSTDEEGEDILDVDPISFAMTQTISENIQATLNDQGVFTISKIDSSGTGVMNTQGDPTLYLFLAAAYEKGIIDINEFQLSMHMINGYDLTSLGAPSNDIWNQQNLSAFGISQDEVPQLKARLKNIPKLTKIIVEEGITTVGSDAFGQMGNSLVDITLPSTIVTIDGEAFRNSYFRSVNIPSAVKSIGEDAFQGWGSKGYAQTINFEASSLDGITMVDTLTASDTLVINLGQ